MSILTWESVRLMRAGRAEGRSLSDLAEEFGVAFQTVSKIVRGERWAEG